MTHALATLKKHFAIDKVDGLEVLTHTLVVLARKRGEQAVGRLSAAAHQRALRVGQEVGGARRGIEHRIDLARIERAALRAALHQPEDTAVHSIPRAAST